MQARTHNAANELIEIDWPTVPPVVEGLTYGKAGNLRSRALLSHETVDAHDAWNRLVKVDSVSTTSRTRCSRWWRS